LNSAVEKLSPTRVKLSIEVPFAELAPHIDGAYKSLSEKINIPGFRKGKVPSAMIDQRVGRAAVLDEANIFQTNFTGANLANAKLSNAGTGLSLGPAPIWTIPPIEWPPILTQEMNVVYDPFWEPAPIFKQESLWAFTSTNFSYSILINTDFTNSNLTNANFSYANLTNAKLRFANLTNANLAYAEINCADLFQSILINANLVGATLWGTDLSDANLVDANMTYAKLNGAILTSANLNGANLTNAVLWGADLTDATLEGTKVDNADFTRATIPEEYSDLNNND
jgi:uncharacterized protein YjbI with pentapeptide repeats